MLSKKFLYIIIAYTLIILLFILSNDKIPYLQNIKKTINFNKEIINNFINFNQLINFIIRILFGYYYSNYWTIIFIADCSLELHPI